MKWLLLLLLSLAMPVGAEVRVDCSQALASGQTTTGRSANQAMIHSNAWRPSIAFQYFRNAGTATVQLEACCGISACDPTNNALWAFVEGSQKVIDGTTVTAGVGIDNPRCTYAANVTVCTGCNVDVRCDVSPDQ